MAQGKYGEAYPSENLGFGDKLRLQLEGAGRGIKNAAVMSTQPQGQQDPSKPLGDRVLGMKADEFSMLFGKLAAAIAPGTTGGRMGEAVAQDAGVKYNNRIEAEKPEAQLAQMRLQDIQKRMTPEQFAAPNVINPLMASASMAPAGPPNMFLPPEQAAPVQAPVSFAQAYGQQAEDMTAPSEVDYRKTTTAAARENVSQLQLMNEKLSKIMPAEIKTANAGAQTAEAGARSAVSSANVAEATEPQRIQAASAELNKLYQEGSLLEKSNQYFKQMNVDMPQAQLSLAERKLEEDVKTRRSAMFADASKQFSALTAAIDSNTIKTIEKASTREAPGIMMNSGSSLINEGINYYNQTGHLQDIDLADSRRTQLGATITTGMNYMVDGINTAKDIGSKIEMTNQLIQQIDSLRSKGQPQVADAYEQALFHNQGPLAGKVTTHYFKADEVYNPKLVLKAYRSGVK